MPRCKHFGTFLIFLPHSIDKIRTWRYNIVIKLRIARKEVKDEKESREN